MLSELMVDVYKRLIIQKEDILLKAIEQHLGRPFDKDKDARDFNIIRLNGNEWYAYKGVCFGVWSMEPSTFPMSPHIRVSYNFTFRTNPELDKQIKYTNMESDNETKLGFRIVLPEIRLREPNSPHDLAFYPAGTELTIKGTRHEMDRFATILTTVLNEIKKEAKDGEQSASEQ